MCSSDLIVGFEALGPVDRKVDLPVAERLQGLAQAAQAGLALAAHLVQVDLDGDDLDHAFYGMELGAGQENFDVTGIDAVVAAVDVNAADFTMKNCEILMADAGGQCTEFILTDANADRLKVYNCLFRSPNAGANNAISIVGTPDGIEIVGNRILGDFGDGCIHNPTGWIP